MKNKIVEMLETKVNEIFFELQNELDIECGDISPMDEIYLHCLIEKTAKSIDNVLKDQLEKQDIEDALEDRYQKEESYNKWVK